MIAPLASEFGGTDRFAVVRRIGAGGMGVVYEVWDREREAALALKTLRSLSGHRLSLFKNEFRALQGVSHRNLVGLGELVEHKGQWFFTMELVDGAPFLSWVCPHRVETRATVTIEEAVSFDLSTVATVDERPPGAGPTGDPDEPRVKAYASFEEARLRDGLRQLATGLLALHARGKVHRDIKPSNVLVAPDGRVVILDFGLIRDVGDAEDVDHVMGTPAYMAPEQAAHAGIGPAVDWYAVGVMIYAALAGRLPFVGTIDEVLAAKAASLPVRPGLIADAVPADLDDLCMRLLAIDPASRAGGGEVLAALGGEAGEAAFDEAFLGRDAELTALDEALAVHGPLVVTVRGESGVGKSTLLGRWLARTMRGGAVVFAGRCYEREAVPYKAVDGVVDAMARWLSGQPDEVIATLAPARAGLLARVFPALAPMLAPPPPRGSPWTETSGTGTHRAIDPGEERRQLFEALRALLGKIGARHRLVVSIDDLQWADVDSLAMLAALLRTPDAPALTLVVAERTEQSAGFAPPCPTRQVDVGPLAAKDAAILAATFLPAEPPDIAASIASEAHGHPLFVMELARARRRREAGGITRLEDVVRRRLDGLAPDDRAVIEVVAAAGAPIAQAVAAEAAGVTLGPLAAALVRLRDEHLVRTGGATPEDLVDAYHSRIRSAVLEQLDAARATEIHGRLAAALERRADVDAELLFGHWLEAGERARARRYAIAAADLAASALAFERAARLYRAALELGDEDGGDLRKRLGGALVDSGRGAEAARVYQEAAAGAEGREALDLRRLAAEQLLRSGHVDEGTDALREVLAGVGLRLPATGRAAIPSLLALRARLKLRGLALRRGGGLDPDALARVDACWSAAVGLLMVDSVRAAAFQSRMLRLALDAGDPYRAALALALEAGLIASGSAHAAPRVAAILAQARELAEESGKPHAHGFVAAAIGISAILQGRFAEGLAASEDAAAILADCTGVTWERDTIATQMSWAQIYLGRFAEISVRVPIAIREAEDRDDRYLATALRTGTLVWLPLVRGDTDGARVALDEGIHRWSDRGFLHQHWDDLLGRAELDLHLGDAERALARMRDGWRSLEKAYVLQIQISREEAVFVRGRAALRRATQLGASSSSGLALVKAAASDAARLHAERVPYITALADLLAAGVAAARTDLETSATLLRRSISVLDPCGLALHAAVARLRLAALVGGTEATTLRAAAHTYATRENVTALAAITDHLAPGF